MDGFGTWGFGQHGLSDGLDLFFGHAAAEDKCLGNFALSWGETNVRAQAGGGLGGDFPCEEEREFGCGSFES